LFTSSVTCGSNSFKGYFDDAKEFKNQEKDSRVVSSFQESRIKNNQEQNSRIKRRLNHDKYENVFSKTE